MVFASAGLPRPYGHEGYAATNHSRKYASIIDKSWSSQEDIDRSLAKIAQIDAGGNGQHPLILIGWSNFPATRASLGHPLLAVANHGAADDDGARWLHGWASTSEKGFFGVGARGHESAE